MVAGVATSPPQLQTPSLRTRPFAVPLQTMASRQVQNTCGGECSSPECGAGPEGKEAFPLVSPGSKPAASWHSHELGLQTRVRPSSSTTQPSPASENGSILSRPPLRNAGGKFHQGKSYQGKRRHQRGQCPISASLQQEAGTLATEQKERNAPLWSNGWWGKGNQLSLTVLLGT